MRVPSKDSDAGQTMRIPPLEAWPFDSMFYVTTLGRR